MIKLNGREIEFKVFPNGESYADIPSDILPYSYKVNREVINDSFKFIPKEGYNKIYLKFENDTDIYHLICIKDYVDSKWPHLPCILEMPYIPYSRMDRQEEKRLFTLKTFAKIVNEMNFISVRVMEPHSEVSIALIDRVEVINKTSELVHKAIMDKLNLSGSAWLSENETNHEYGFGIRNLYKKAEEAGIWLVFPDAGAEKRYRKQIKYNNVLTCSKNRDFNTGRIHSITLNNVESVYNCKIAIICDDLSSKGGTFIGTANEIRKNFTEIEEIILCVTHCENTIYEGSVLFGNEIDKVYTTNSILNEPRETEPAFAVKEKLIIENI